MVYDRKNFDINLVDFPVALETVIEALAETIHNVPYKDLPEIEKAHYRQLVRAMLARLLAEGCRIEMPTRLLNKETSESVEVLQKVPADDDVELAISWGRLTEAEAELIQNWINAMSKKITTLEKGDQRCQKIYDIAKKIKTTYVAFFMEAHDLASEAFKKL